jgi:4-diphosphocytidyl-2-C-methyl-D-erythritol kinase
MSKHAETWSGDIKCPAKINLALHVLRRREDGYHELDSLVAPIGIHDTLKLEIGRRAEDSLVINGPLATALGHEAAADNLVLKAVRAMREALGQKGLSLPAVSAVLEKHIPVAAGLGGGSSNASSCLMLINSWAGSMGTSSSNHALSNAELAEIALKLGADCPFFLEGGPARMEGIGEQLGPVTATGRIPLVVVNPMASVSTPAVFKALEARERSGLPPLPDMREHDGLSTWLKAHTRNDLQEPARHIEHMVSDCLAALETTRNYRLVRMSGSGATCFALYQNPGHAAAAAETLRKAHPDWWVQASYADLETPRQRAQA